MGRVLITGSNGFIGKNLVSTLSNNCMHEVLEWNRGNNFDTLKEGINSCDFVVHLAGENRPKSNVDFITSNELLTEYISISIAESLNKPKLIFASSIQAELDNPYGRSKKNSEELIVNHLSSKVDSATILRLPGVFGKWSRPNYNSVVATFCYNISREIPIEVNNPDTQLRLIYIDDLIKKIIHEIEFRKSGINYEKISPEFSSSTLEISSQINLFHTQLEHTMVPEAASGFIRALYATYLSFLPTQKFSNKIKFHADKRGKFAEFIKTKTCGQVSFFTANPGEVRGGHFHHTKNERFFVISGSAIFKFRNLSTNEKFELNVTEETHEVITSVPGWIHQITNTGNAILIVLLWSNELFDPCNPDTFTKEI